MASPFLKLLYCRCCKTSKRRAEIGHSLIGKPERAKIGTNQSPFSAAGASISQPGQACQRTNTDSCTNLCWYIAYYWSIASYQLRLVQTPLIRVSTKCRYYLNVARNELRLVHQSMSVHERRSVHERSFVPCMLAR